MLARASKRSLPQDAYRQTLSCLEGLQLPFLCPALYTETSYSRNTSSITQIRSKRGSGRPRPKTRKSTIANQPPSRRNLASAATAEQVPQYDTYVPWDESVRPSHGHQQAFNEQSSTILPVFDSSSSPIIIKDSLSTHPRKFRATKSAIGGNINEIHQTLHACLQVGRLDRAAALVRRLNEIYKPNAPGLLAAHNDYITELSHRVVQNKDQSLLHGLQRWFQTEMVDAGIQPNETTYAMLIRASLKASGDKDDDMAKKYLNIADEKGVAEETNDLLSLYGVSNHSQPFLPESEPDVLLSDHLEIESAMPQTTADQPTKQVDEVRGMEQKGLGLSTLKRTLSIFSDAASDSALDDRNISPVDRQSLLEANTVNAAMDRWREEDAHLKSIGVNSGLSTSSIGSMMWRWHEKLVPLIKRDVKQSQEAEQKRKRTKSDDDLLAWGPYLQSLAPEKVSAVTILSAMRVCGTDPMDERGVRVHHLVHAIGDAVQNESIAEAIRRKKDKHWRGHSQILKTRSRHDSLAKLVRGSMSQEYEQLQWGVSEKVKLGAALLSHLMEFAKIKASRQDPRTGTHIQEEQPVFFHTYQYIAGKRVGVVRLNSTVLEDLARVPVVSALAKYLPMVCEPKPWAGFYEGGFLEYPVPVVRLSSFDPHSKRYAITASQNGDMTQVFAGLDVLAKTPWNINRFVFDTMLEAWNSGEAIASIPPENHPNDLPPEPSLSDNPSERFRWIKNVREIENHRSGLRSQRCFQNFQLEVARAYLNDTFYFPHNCDFRGRAYPMVPFLNHMGADNARGLLMFAQGKELTSDGLWWLKIHLANTYGYDKASFPERLHFTETHLPQIQDSVDKPLSGKRWWLEAEDPWQCLAACKELTNAVKLPDPTKYVCKLAIHQDGTCNGLQHYAALGGDVAGAQQVNLEPGERPSDIYTSVSELVKAEIAKDATKGSELAKALNGKVTRKVVKQTVMTNVYGVTFTGAKRQVRKQLDDLLIGFPDSREVNLMLASQYIARKIFAALATMFNGAHDIQHWLIDCAGRISDSLAPEQIDYVEKTAKGQYPQAQFKTAPLKGPTNSEMTDFKSTVIWTTPLKMPIVQPYRKKSSRRIETNLQRITITNRSAADPVHKAKQLQAFPPNFIHSLDATHMFLTAMKCHEVGLTFAAIHDSFWTHAGDVQTLNRITRDAFIRMHSEDIIGRLAAEFKARYKDYMQLAHVRLDSPTGRKIIAWRKQRAKQIKSVGSGLKAGQNTEARKWDELLLERRRLNLLASEDPKEQEEGKLMHTAGKIFSEEADEQSLAPENTKTAMIGLTSSSRDTKLKANKQLDVGIMDNVDAAADVEDDVEVSNNGLGDEDEEHELLAGTEKKGKSRSKKTWVWLPLTFPPVPKKGDFDVTRLKDSQYFFS